MFSKSKINDPIETDQDSDKPKTAAASSSAAPVTQAAKSPVAASAVARTTPTPSKPAAVVTAGGPSVIGSDLKIIGNLETPGDLQIEGNVEGDIRANLLTVGESSTIRGEIIAEDVVVNGRVIGRLRGAKVRLSASANVEGDILHKTIAIEAGANFEGSVKRSEDPLSSAASQSKPHAVDSDKSKESAQDKKAS